MSGPFKYIADLKFFCEATLFLFFLGTFGCCLNRQDTITVTQTETSRLIRGQMPDTAVSETPFPALDTPFPAITSSLLNPSENNQTTASSSSDNTADSASPPTLNLAMIPSDNTVPPGIDDFPSFLMDSQNTTLEDDVTFDQNGYLVQENVGGQMTAVPERNRESISDKEKTEKELEKRYREWVQARQNSKSSQKNVPRYLQPLSNDQDVFNDPNSPFRRPKEEESTFVRQVTAADLSLMTETSSSRELMDWEKEQDMPVDWSKYALTKDRVKNWFGMGPNEQASLEYMRQACEKHSEYMKTHEAKRLKEAAQLYEKAVTRAPGPESLLAEDGTFFSGECWFFYHDFNRAKTAYAHLVSTYPGTIYKQTAMKRLYYIGCFWVACSEKDSTLVNLSNSQKPRFSSFAGAKKAFEAIFMNDASDTGLAPDALFALANAYMRRGVKQGDGAFESAARYYRQLYEYYPGSKYTEQAYQLAIIALRRSYQGPFYDVSPLKEAQEIAQAAQKSGRGNMDLIYEQLNEIDEQLAQSLWTIGEYYEKRGNNASARSYYSRLVREHPGSEYAQMAAKRYSAIQDAPAETDQFAWIRPVIPIIPKSDNQYFEEQPSVELTKMAAKNNTHISSNINPEGTVQVVSGPTESTEEKDKNTRSESSSGLF